MMPSAVGDLSALSESTRRTFYVIVASATNLGTSRATLVSIMDYAGITKVPEVYGCLDRLLEGRLITRYDRGRPCKFQLANDWDRFRVPAERFIAEHRDRVERLVSMRQLQRVTLADAVRGEGPPLPDCTIADVEEIPTSSNYQKWRFTLRTEHFVIRNCVYVATATPFVAGPTKKDRHASTGYADVVRIDPALSAHLCLQIQAHLSQSAGDAALR